jgi:hypothetical protein
MRAGWNATRRNRNIGTARSGLGQENRFAIPSCRSDIRPFWSRLTRYTIVRRRLNGKNFGVLVEPTRPNSVYPCTVDDLFHLLRYVPTEHLDEIELLILRQPKRKEEVFAPCWGRLAYRVAIAGYDCPAIILEAIELGKRWRWSRSLRPDAADELQRLRADGHKITATRQGYIIEPTLEAARSTQLYRSLFHEIGHWVHYVKIVERPSSGNIDLWPALSNRYDKIPSVQKETFAHRYADSLRAQLSAEKAIPFERRLDEGRLALDGLCLNDFSC